MTKLCVGEDTEHPDYCRSGGLFAEAKEAREREYLGIRTEDRLPESPWDQVYNLRDTKENSERGGLKCE